jgi:ABC-type sugar transport system ATPase subunit
MAGVILEHLSKTYSNGVQAVRDVSLDVADGELFVLVGPSGCGKTTTLRLVAGLEDATTGKIKIGDCIVNGVAPAARDVAMVFQNGALYPHKSAYENMAFGLAMRRTPRAEIDRRIREAANALSIGGLLSRRPGELSGGERQRVALGRAIVRQPRVFLLDEPLSGLDEPLRAELRAEIVRLHSRLAAAIIYVTHDQGEAMMLGDRIGVMDRGVILQIDAPMDVYRRPANMFVASFIGSPATNLLAGEVCEGKFRLKASAADSVSLEVGASVPDGPAVLGLRADDLLLNDNGRLLGTTVIDSVEQLGHETLAYFVMAGRRHAMRLPAEANIALGQPTRLFITPGAHAVFSIDGRRLN